MKATSLGSVLIPCLLTAGCVWDDMIAQLNFLPDETQHATSVAYTGPNPIPWQLTPASAASRAQGEVTSLVDVPTVGKVRGTEKAVADWNRAIIPFSKDDKVVEACKKAFEPQATSAGAYYLEAASAGPKQKAAKGWHQQVFFRILYHDPSEGGVEVRQASIDCTVDDAGTLRKASVV